MNRIIFLAALLSAVLAGCKSKHEDHATQTVQPPAVSTDGKVITFPAGSNALSIYATDTVRKENFEARYQAPASVAVSIVQPEIQGGRLIVLFDDDDLSSSYTQFLQHLINIRTLKINLARVQDLSAHGAATGKEVLDAETQLANEEAAITEHEGKLKLAGMDVDKLRNPTQKEAWLVCEVPENQISSLKIGTNCRVTFSAFGESSFGASIHGIGAQVDNVTRMVKVLVTLPNPTGKFEVGMFAKVFFELAETNAISIPVSALVNVEGKDFVFIKTSDNKFERREVLLGQQFENRAVILNGLADQEAVVTAGVMQLKGISFGY